MNDFIRDLIADIRFCDRCISKQLHVEENTKYRAECLADLRKCWATRHAYRMDQCGYPTVLTD